MCDRKQLSSALPHLSRTPWQQMLQVMRCYCHSMYTDLPHVHHMYAACLYCSQVHASLSLAFVLALLSRPQRNLGQCIETFASRLLASHQRLRKDGPISTKCHQLCRTLQQPPKVPQQVPSLVYTISYKDSLRQYRSEPMT